MLLHPLAKIKIRMLMPIMINGRKEMMNLEGMTKRHRGHEYQRQGNGETGDD